MCNINLFFSEVPKVDLFDFGTKTLQLVFAAVLLIRHGAITVYCLAGLEDE